MCDPISISTMVYASMAISAATATASTVASEEQAAANKTAIDQQSQAQAQQLSMQAGQQQSQAAMQARAARAQSVAAAGASGINLDSNSFVASLQTTTMNQANNEGLILENEKNQQAGREASVNSDLAEKASSPTFLGAATNIGLSVGGAYANGEMMMGLDNPKGDGLSPYVITGAAAAGHM